MDKEYYIITLIKQGFLQDSYIRETEEEATRLAERLQRENHSTWDDEGYVVIEKGGLTWEVSNKRVAQYDLDEKLEEEESEA